MAYFRESKKIIFCELSTGLKYYVNIEFSQKKMIKLYMYTKIPSKYIKINIRHNTCNLQQKTVDNLKMKKLSTELSTGCGKSMIIL